MPREETFHLDAAQMLLETAVLSTAHTATLTELSKKATLLQQK